MIRKLPCLIFLLAFCGFSQNKTTINGKIVSDAADIDESNNTWGAGAQPSKFQLFKARAGGGAPVRGQSVGANPMQLEKKTK